MRNYIGRIVSAKGDSTQQVIDLLVFLGYFSICLVAGGIAYDTKYNNYFSLDVPIYTNFSQLAVAFVTEVLAQAVTGFLPRYMWWPSSFSTIHAGMRGDRGLAIL